MENDLIVNANTDVKVVRTPIDYSITYELDGGTNAPENPDSYTVEDAIILMPPTQNGYTFVGWTYNGQTDPQKKINDPGRNSDRTFELYCSLEES